MITKLRYGNTNTFLVRGNGCGLLVDTDYAGTLPQFFRCIKQAEVSIKDIQYLLVTHYHPDHMGIAGELQKLGIKLLIADVQKPFIHFSDSIFGRDKHLSFEPPDEDSAQIITCGESREFLHEIGIEGEMIHTPSHSEDSITVILDDGNCIVGDLEPFEFISGYEDNQKLKDDWKTIMSRHPRRILFAHANEKEIPGLYSCGDEKL